jgi:hypothetical protein
MIDFSAVLTDLDGVAFIDATADRKEVPLTLGRAAAAALTTPVQGVAQSSGADHLARMMLAMKVKDGGALELSTEDVETIKQRIAGFYASSVVVGKCWLLLDPALANLAKA